MYAVTTYEIVSEIAAITGKVVRLVYGDGFSVGCRGEEIELTIPRGTSYMTPAVRMGILHETMHILYTDDISTGVNPTDCLVKAGYKPEQIMPLFDFLNAFEDIRIQLKGEEELPGARYIFQAGFDEITPEVFEGIYREYEKGNPFALPRAFLCSAIAIVPEYSSVSELYYSRHGMSRTQGWMRWACDQSKFVQVTGELKGFHPIKQGSDYELRFREMATMLKDTKTTQAGFDLASSWYLEAYIKLLPDNLREIYEDQKKLQEMMKALMDALEEATKQAAKDGGAKGAGSAAGNGLLKAGTKDEKAAEDMLKRLQGYGGGFTRVGLRADQKNWTTRIKVIDDKSNQLNAQLAPILDRVKEWQERGSERNHLKRGRVDAHSLHRVALDEIDIFKRELEPEVTDDVAFSVVVDLSGSMFGDEEGDDPLNTAFGLGAGLNKALTKIKKPCTLITFSNNAKVILGDGQSCTPEVLADGMADSGGGTNLSSGIELSLKKLAERPETLKVQFILSDGDVNPQYLGESVKLASEAGVLPYFIYVSEAKEHLEPAFQKLTQDALGAGNKLKYAVVTTDEAAGLIPQLSKFVEGILEGKGIN